MKNYITRLIEKEVQRLLAAFPVVAVLGPRQSGKSTLARHLLNSRRAILLDLELPSDANKLTDAEAFLSANLDSLVCLDEIQRTPDIFPLLRSLCDRSGQPGRYLVLGSSSPELLRQTSESLAGRIAYIELTPFLRAELPEQEERTIWFRGGFPPSMLAEDDMQSLEWRRQFIRTFLERDLAVMMPGLSIQTMRRLWFMLAHCNGQLLNASKLAESLGVSPPTIRSYLDFLEKAYMMRLLRPWHTNMKKRLVKSPKLFFQDTGLLHALLDIETPNHLFGHPVYGSSWECYVLNQILGVAHNWSAHFYRTSKGAEIDLILTKSMERLAIECKASTSPQVSRGFYTALDDLGFDHGYVLAPIPDGNSYMLNDRVRVCSVQTMVQLLQENARKAAKTLEGEAVPSRTATSHKRFLS